MCDNFVHLHNHSTYSLLDGFSNIKKMVARAKEMGMPALGITDHGAMHGVIEFYKACKEAEINPIIGMESYMAPRLMTQKNAQYDRKPFHLLLLAENQKGYQNLLKIASASSLEGYYYRPRIDHDYLAAHAEGLICTTGCLAAEVPKAIQNGNHEQATKLLDYYYEVFGHDNFFFELQDHEIPELREVNKGLIDLAKRYNGQFVATNDTHYVDQSDAKLHDVMLCIQTRSVLNDPKRMRMSCDTYYLRSPEEMHKLFGHIDGAMENSLLIAERCEVNLDSDGYHLPLFDVPPEYLDAANYLLALCDQGLQERVSPDWREKPDYVERLEYELGVINRMGFDAYFLIVWDLCMFSAERGIWYGARGSAAGSLVAYALKITFVDPLELGLIFERFLNPGRISMPDIDLDFPDDRRSELLEYCVNKYGDDKVASIITFGEMKARAAIRDVGRVMDIPLPEVDRVAKMVPSIQGKSPKISDALGDGDDGIEELRTVYKTNPTMREMLDVAAGLEGTFRNVGTHAAGVIVSDKPLTEYIPLTRPPGSTDPMIQSVTQFEMAVVEDLGLLKVDFLGLRTLTIMARACELIKERHNIDFDINTIPVDDPKSFELLGDGNVPGVFQVEGAGMRKFLMEMHPENLENVIAMISLYRPGPIDFIPTYIRRMHGKEETEYKHPSLEPIFAETYGIAVYQEQIMRAAVDLAGYKLSESDELRKAIAKKKQKLLVKHEKMFVEGCAKQGTMSKAEAKAVFEDWLEFARYGFNKAHAAAYGVISVQTAYLKAHYPVEYMSALLSAEKGNTEKVTLYTANARTMNVEILPPDVNNGDWDFTIEDDDEGSHVRFGMGAIKNVGEGPVAEIVRGRGDEPFKSIDDFAARCDLRKVGKRALECLIKVGALDDFGQRNVLLAALDQIVSISGSTHKAAELGQVSMFDMMTGPSNSSITLPKNIPEVKDRELRKWEKELVGTYVGEHPLIAHLDDLQHVITAFSGELDGSMKGRSVTVAGTIGNIKPHTTKKGDPMAFIDLEDMQGQLSLVIFPRVWKEVGEWVEMEQLVVVTGKVDGNDGTNILVDAMSQNVKIVKADESSMPAPPEPPPFRYDYQDSFGPPPEPDSVAFAPTTPAVAPPAPKVEKPKPAAKQPDLKSTKASDVAPSKPTEDPPAPKFEQSTGIDPAPVVAPQTASASVAAAETNVAVEIAPEVEAAAVAEVVAKVEAAVLAPTPDTILQPIIEDPENGTVPDFTPDLHIPDDETPPDDIWALFDDQQQVLDAHGDPYQVEAVNSYIDVPEQRPQTPQPSAAPPPPEDDVPDWALEMSGDRRRKSAPAVNEAVPAYVPNNGGGMAIPPLPKRKAPQVPQMRGAQRPPLMDEETKRDLHADDTGPTKCIIVTIRPTRDLFSYSMRTKWAYNILTSFPGKDHFKLRVFEDEHDYELEFPNITTGYCDELMSQLKSVVKNPDDIEIKIGV